MLEFLPFDPHQALKFTLILLKGAVMTLQITAGSLVVAVVLGLIMAFVKTSRVRIARFLVSVYIEIFRDIPTLTLLFILYFGLAYMGFKIEPVPAAIMGLGAVGGAILTEVFRSGFEALHHGQREAALAVGMTPSKAYRYIIMPQAVRIVLPPLLNMLIILLKDSSICSLISTPELMLRAKDLASMSFLPMHAYLLAGLIYFLMACPLSLMTRQVEKRLRRGMRKITA
jgi:His/Glu/Gln/Arg/opine family amino acid ABC transporter permease subunit